MTLSHCFLGFTLGQFCMGLKLISNDGCNYFKRALLRNTLLAPFFLINFLKVYSYYLYRLTWHDQISGTRVIDLNEDDTFFNRGACLNSLSVFIFLMVSIFSFKTINNSEETQTEKRITLEKAESKNKTFVLLFKQKSHDNINTPYQSIIFFPHNLVTLDFKNYNKEYNRRKRNRLVSTTVRAPANFPNPPPSFKGPVDESLNENNQNKKRNDLKEYNEWRHKSRARFHGK